MAAPWRNAARTQLYCALLGRGHGATVAASATAQ